MRGGASIEPPLEDVPGLGGPGIDSAGPRLMLPNGAVLSAQGLPSGSGREQLERALVVQESER